MPGKGRKRQLAKSMESLFKEPVSKAPKVKPANSEVLQLPEELNPPSWTPKSGSEELASGAGCSMISPDEPCTSEENPSKGLRSPSIYDLAVSKKIGLKGVILLLQLMSYIPTNFLSYRYDYIGEILETLLKRSFHKMN